MFSGSAAGQAAVAADASNGAADRRIWRDLRDGADVAAVIVLLGTEAEQGGDVSDFIELGIVLHVKQFDVVANYRRQNGFGRIDHAANFATAHGTEVHQMGIEVAAAGALDGLRMVGLAEQQGLHFAGFEGAQHAAQSGDTASAAASLAQSFADRFVTAFLLRGSENTFGMGADYVAGCVADLGGEPTQQLLQGAGMQLRFKRRPMNFLTAQDPMLKHALVQSIFHKISEDFEMLACLLGNLALGAASVVAVEAITAAARKEDERNPCVR